ncbi:MAG: hypothetical protein QM760_20940 [Nibricoccus sp.]
MKPNFWRDFRRQKDVEAAVRLIIDDHPFYQSFEAPVISDLIAERHYFCRLIDLRPTSFKKTEENTPYRFYGLFESYGWHAVSWRKCLKDPPSKEAIITTALRNRTLPEKARFRDEHPTCARCDEPSEEAHHAEPTFKDIIARVFAVTSEQEIESAIASWDWFKKEDFAVPNGHAIEKRFDEIHAKVRFEALCRKCHNLTKRG